MSNKAFEEWYKKHTIEFGKNGSISYDSPSHYKFVKYIREQTVKQVIDVLDTALADMCYCSHEQDFLNRVIDEIKRRFEVKE